MFLLRNTKYVVFQIQKKITVNFLPQYTYFTA